MNKIIIQYWETHPELDEKKYNPMHASVGPKDSHPFRQTCNRGSFTTSSTGCNDLEHSSTFLNALLDKCASTLRQASLFILKIPLLTEKLKKITIYTK